MVEQRSPKPRAEGSSPSAPAKNSATAFAVALFFVMPVGETEARGACRASPPKRRLWRMQRGGDGAAVGDWQGGPAAADRAGHRKRACEASSSPSAPATKPAKTLGFRRFSFFMCCIAIWCILVRISGFPTCPHRLHPSPAPKTHPVSPFSGFSGCVSLFLPSFDLQNFRLCFCASCRIAFTD